MPKQIKNEITMFWHCKKCLAELPHGLSPREWTRPEVGWTKKGIQAWCVRHDCNICHIDLRGQKVDYAG